MMFDMNVFNKNKKFILIILGVIISLLIISFFMPNNDNRLPEHDLQENGNEQINSLIINEIMSANGGVFASPTGELFDWIELYNGNDYDIDLTGYGLTDKDNEIKWVFPKQTIASKSYLIVYLTGEKRDGLYASFKISSNGTETIFLKKPNGKVVDAVDITAMNKNEVIARNLKGDWFTSTKATPGFINTEEGYTEFQQSLLNNDDALKINEILPNNAGNFMNSYDNFSGYIEVINTGDKTINLKNYGLSDSEKTPFRYRMPDISLKPNEMVAIYMGEYENNNKEYYTGFKLQSKTGVAILTNNKGKIIERVNYENVPNGIALVKEAGNFYQSSIISPGYSNDTKGVTKFAKNQYHKESELIINEVMNSNSSYLAHNGNQYYDWIELKNNSKKTINLKDYCLTTTDNNLCMFTLPDVELKANGFYIIMASGDSNLSNNSYKHADFKLSEIESLYLTKNNEIMDSLLIADIPLGYSEGRSGGEGVYYFKTPTPGKKNNTGVNSVAYIPSLSITPGVYNDIENINLEINGSGTIYYTLDGSVPTTSSKVYKGPILLKKTTVVKAVSYDNGKIKSDIVTGSYIINENHILPVMSVSINPNHFNHIQSDAWNENLEYSAYAEYYEEDGSFQIPCGFKLFGGSTRGLSKKSFSLKFRKKYGEGSLNYQVFDNRDYSEFNSLVLRSGSQDQSYAFIRDILMTSLVDGVTNMEVQAYKSIILYINGRYWGIYNIREKIDDDFIGNHFNVDAEKANIVKINNEITAGTDTEYRQLVKFLNNNNLSLDKNYEYVKTKLNIESFADFWAAETWVTNNDIINTRFYWHPDIDNGRINMIFFDLDYAMWNYRNNYYLFQTNPEGMSDFKVSTDMMRSLIKNKEFKTTYLERISYQVKNVWNEERVITRINELYNYLLPEMPRNQKRWGLTMEKWEENIEDLKFYARNREGYLKSHTKSFFNLTDKEMDKYFGE